ncbi:MAG TPA: hypothetical protein VMW89_05770 [Desulfatiglandales bacterium]|nr:hypothetical protein [Desulfatiglandales bacterium]
MSEELANKIGEFFMKNKQALINHSTEDESKLLTSLEFKDKLDLENDESSVSALFGWGNLKSDFSPKDKRDTIIEVKYIRTTKISSGNNYNECYVKDSLSQIIEQAACKRKQNAILVVIDSGRAAARDWCSLEVKFISMFKNNPFKIQLSIVRVALDPANGDVSFKIF